MKNNIIEKMNLPLSLWQELLEQHADFIEIAINLRTGNREIAGNIELAAGSDRHFISRLPGETLQGSPSDVMAWLKERLLQYDSVILILRQHGKSQMLAADRKGVSFQPQFKDPVKQKATAAVNVHSYGASDKRQYRIKLDEAAGLLEVIGITDKNGKLKNDKYRKYQQIDRFVELAEPILNELMQDEGSLEVYDLACGKSYLSFVLNYYIREKLGRSCRITGIDISPQVVESSTAMADKLGWRNMSFYSQDLREFSPASPVSLCISLHACDIATDMALAAAVRAGSKAILAVPCCQRELLASDYKLDALAGSVMSSGILKARLADLITDGMRLLLLRSAGYDASVIEYISPLETPKNLMIRAVKTGKPDRQAWQEYKRLSKECGVEITMGRELRSMINRLHQGEKTMITIATGNRDKVSEIREIISSSKLDWQTMSDAGFSGDIVEDGSSYIANALIKARAVHDMVGGWVIADDSGLSVDVLDGAPGIYSARFAGENAAYKDKIARLHEMLEPWPSSEWNAAFICAIALIAPDGREWTIQADSPGLIAQQAAGSNGFGYDPIFYVPEFGCTMAEMSPDQKHAISHRGKALRLLLEIIDREKLFDV